MTVTDATVVLYDESLDDWDLVGHVQSITVDRGRDRELDPLRAGTCTFVLRNDTGFWQPGNSGETITSGGAVDVSPPADLLNPGRIVWVSAGGAQLFAGRIRTVDYFYDGAESTVRVLAEDGLAALARLRFTGFDHPRQASGTTVRDVLDWAAWDTAISAAPGVFGSLDPAVGVSTATVLDASSDDLDGRSALNYLADLEASEQGRIFVAASGQFVVFGRYAEPAWTGSATLSTEVEFLDADSSATGGWTSVPYVAMRGSGGGDVLYTRVFGESASTGNVLSVEAAGSSTYGLSDLQVSGLLNAFDGEVEGVLSLLADVYDSPEWRVDQVTVKPLRLSGAAQTAALEVDLQQTVRVKFTPVAGSAVSTECRVQRITHRITPSDHTMTVGLAVKVVDPDGLFVLGSSSLGGSDVLGY